MAEDGKIIYKVKIDDSGAVDEAERAGRRAGEAAERSAQKSSSFIQEVMTGAARRIGEAFVNMAARAGEGMADMVKSSLDSVASLEQNIGGVETLFKGSADRVIENAKRAYETAGLSANAYMETVTSFSASLLQSVGGDTERAASLADMAIIDMSDNANKMGTSMESIQNAYQGFAKQNYTMLDNLKLGYGGTKTEMQRLILDAEKLDETFKATRDENGNLTMSYADVVKAIHTVQTEMGITGTTALEASSTIEGSVNSAKAAWDNFLTGTISSEDLADAIMTAAENIASNLESIMSRFGETIPALIDALSAGFGTMAAELGPSILEAVLNIILALGQAFLENLPILISTGTQLMMSLLQGLIENLPLVLDAGIQIIFAIVDGLTQALPELIPAIVDVILTIVEKLTDPDTVVKLIQAAFQIILAIAEGLIRAVPKLVEKVPVIVSNLLEGFVRQWPEFVKGGSDLLDKLGEGIMAALGGLVLVVDKVITSIWEQISGLINSALSWGSDLIGNFISGIWARAQDLWNTIASIAGSVRDYLGFSEPKLGPLSNFHTYAPDMIDLFAKGLKDNEIVLTRTIKDVFDLEPAIDSAMPSLDSYAMTMPALASGMLERSASEAISYNNSSVGGATYYIYNTIDAKNVKDFNSVVDLLSSAETIRRMQ